MFCFYWIRSSYLVLLTAIPLWGLVPHWFFRALLQYFRCFVQQNTFFHTSPIMDIDILSPTPTVIPSLCALKCSLSSEVPCSGLGLLTNKWCACASCSLHDSIFIIHSIFLISLVPVPRQADQALSGLCADFSGYEVCTIWFFGLSV